MFVHERANWEFFAVVRGQCSAQLPDRSAPEFHSHYLWVFPPETAHGWQGIKSTSCRVFVFHFSSVPNLLERYTRKHGFIGIPLSPQQQKTIIRLGEELQPHDQRMTEKSLLVYDRALLELTLLALDSVPADRTESTSDFAHRKVEASMTWYMEHMSHKPKLEEVARAVSVSVRHLRRLFQEVRHESPQTVFTQIRLQRAMDMLARTDHKLETIAYDCGFSSSSDFSRVFRANRKINPDAWRRNVLRECNQTQNKAMVVTTDQREDGFSRPSRTTTAIPP